ncbi:MULTISPECIES: menaquinol-cytochrome c reductase cytochrome b/c subunit [Rossellomorea]|jgi:menaquinol-cytochrome c reductase cytochrome b/c subunit|uniref:Menaquinol:cytochrome c reductase cytochrome c subunit n=1 Tax=Rossellomorea aquimaris TaxID=189382 RepID=A0A366EIN1_9BACI|nr:menaquinol-cytochrome c reductase cytochrome b/c subunit [Rossellomorea aquimaris]RBP02267.1 menaquinol-cytochrome c reductase cytochrome b/c subunit [Rossellomorea aquimaris]TYS77393.1 cytochrome C oxidase Cbb3 [Rossellomorea aquimaris]TYS86575.1 cytochrome C oxidase Cbb3 [Rossellomorea aquimaris]
MHRGKGMKFVGDSRVPADRKPNIPKDYSEFPGKTEAFWPNFLLKEWLVGAVFLIGYLCLTVAHPSPLERVADPTDTGYIPLPDWYFLFLYQLLKYTYASGPYNVIGAFVIPGIAFGALLLAPFIDVGPERRPTKRPFAVGFMLLALAATYFLTWESVVTHDWEAAKEQGKIQAEVDIDKESEGYKIYADQKNGCINCHGENLQGGAGPSLVATGLSPEEVADIAKNGKPPGMPAGLFKGSDEELDKLAEFISGLKE